MGIEFINISLPVIIYDVFDHQAIKHKFLNYLSKRPQTPLIQGADSITNTDWSPFDEKKNELTPERQKEYVDIVPVFNVAVRELEKVTGEGYNFYVNTAWFQQYERTSKHNWHVHKNCFYAGIYFVELNHPSQSTLFKFNNQDFRFNVREGQVILFPNQFLHCSPSNEFIERKTVIAFNLCLP
jgi:hypothetical protein